MGRVLACAFCTFNKALPSTLSLLLCVFSVLPWVSQSGINWRLQHCQLLPIGGSVTVLQGVTNVVKPSCPLRKTEGFQSHSVSRHTLLGKDSILEGKFSNFLPFRKCFPHWFACGLSYHAPGRVLLYLRVCVFQGLARLTLQFPLSLPGRGAH